MEILDKILGGDVDTSTMGVVTDAMRLRLAMMYDRQVSQVREISRRDFVRTVATGSIGSVALPGG